MEFLSNREIERVIDLVRNAGTELMRRWPGLGQAAILAVKSKEDGTPVSDADYASNEILTSGLKDIFPDDAIISEENNYPTHGSTAGRTWIIDPLDGTKSFIAGRDDFSVLVSLCSNGGVVAGFMFFPARNSLVWSVGDKGEPQELTVSTSRTITPGRLYVSKMPEFSRPELQCPHIDSGLAFYQIASGELDGLIIRMETHREWDIAAPAASVVRCGGRITDEKGKPIIFGQSPKPCDYCIASNGTVHDELLTLINYRNR